MSAMARQERYGTSEVPPSSSATLQGCKVVQLKSISKLGAALSLTRRYLSKLLLANGLLRRHHLLLVPSITIRSENESVR